MLCRFRESRKKSRLLMESIYSAVFFLLLVQPQQVWSAVTPVTVDFARAQDVPLLKKFGIYNSGIIPQARYTPEILASMGLIKAASLRIDLSIGKINSGFTDLMSGNVSDGNNELDLNFELIDTLAEGLQAQKVMPYWGLSYNPRPFQPVCPGGVGSPECAGSVATCRGFEDKAAVPGTNNYTCYPIGSTPYDDCWKCPPLAEGDERYEDWSALAAVFHLHFLFKGITPVYEEHWNEPDLTEYYNPTLAAFKGSNEDYNSAYEACALKMMAFDANLVFGGIAVANQIRHNPAYPLQPTSEDALIAAAENGLPMDFFTFHSITTAPGIDQVQLMLDRAQTSREVLSSQQLVNITGAINRFNTTEIHCNEFYPNSTTPTLTSVFSSSAYLAALLLETWTLLLQETDLSTVHWAQYMDVFDDATQIGLINFRGQPRPAWWAFRWFSELPVERVEVKVISPYVNGLAGYSERDCAAGVLLWNVPVPKNGRPQEEETLSVALHSLPFAKFDVEAYILDDRKQPWGGFDYAPSVVYTDQSPDSNQIYCFPPNSYSGLKLPVNGTIYLKLIPKEPCLACGNSELPLPDAPILRLHHYSGYRPYKSTSYAHFHPRDWSAYLGTGLETTGFQITGLTAKATPKDIFNISMILSHVEEFAPGAIAGVRMDLGVRLDNGYSTYQQASSYFFYQAGTQPCAASWLEAGAPPPLPELDLSSGAQPPTLQDLAQLASGPSTNASAPNSYLFATQNALTTGVAGRKLQQQFGGPEACGSDANSYVQLPPLYGSEQSVLPQNFYPVTLSSFAPVLADIAHPNWDGRVLMLFALKDGNPGLKARVFVRQQPEEC